MSADKAKELGLKPLARFVTFAVGGVAPDIMGVGPIKAVPKALAKSGLKLADLKMIELNEAFAVQGLAVMQELGMNAGVTNVNGGAIALGHPLGATGAKLTTQLVHALGATGGGFGHGDDVHRRRDGSGRDLRGVSRLIQDRQWNCRRAK